MKAAKSKPRTKRDNDTPEKMSEDSRSNIDTDSSNKVNESLEDLKITEEILQKFYNVSNFEDRFNDNTSTLAVRYTLPLDKQRPLTKKICVLKKAPRTVAAVPSSTLLEQMSIRMDENQRPVQHSILGSLEDFFKMSLDKKKLTLQEIPVEFHNLLGKSSERRPFTAMLPMQRGGPVKENTNPSLKIDSFRKKLDPDTKALRLWEERMMERRNIQTHISKKVQRVPEKMIFNSGEEFRRNLEDKYLISKSIPFYGSGHGYRSGSEFWKQNEVVGIAANGPLHMTNNLAEKGYPPSILHIGVADKIKVEKGIPTIVPLVNTGYTDYANKRYDELKQVICELDPHQPNMEQLIVTGHHTNRNCDLDQSSSELNDMSEASEGCINHESFTSQFMGRPETDQSQNQMYQLSMGPCLFVNTMMLTSSEYDEDKTPLEIRVLFHDYTRNKCVETLHFFNKGSSIIRFGWKKLESYDPFELENKDTRRFYFNTQDEILLPNQELHFPVTFKSDKFGIFSENWRLETLPTLAQGRDIVICLKGVALQRDTLANTTKQIKDYLNFQVANDVVRGILNDIIDSMYYNMRDQGTSVEYLDSECDAFNSTNERIIYDVDNVNSLRKLHQEIAVKEKNMPEEWSLSCRQLREDIFSSESMKSVKKEETCAKFYKYIDKMMFSSIKSDLVTRDILYRIGYRMFLDLGGNMFTMLADLRNEHDIPEMELRLSREKKTSNLSRQRTNNSQSSKTSVKKPNETRVSISAVKIKSKEPSNLLRESTDGLLAEIDEMEKVASRSVSDIDDLQTDNEPLQSTSINTNISKYRTKTFQTVYALLDVAIDNMINFWDEISQK